MYNSPKPRLCSIALHQTRRNAGYRERAERSLCSCSICPTLAVLIPDDLDDQMSGWGLTQVKVLDSVIAACKNTGEEGYISPLTGRWQVNGQAALRRRIGVHPWNGEAHVEIESEISRVLRRCSSQLPSGGRPTGMVAQSVDPQ